MNRLHHHPENEVHPAKKVIASLLQNNWPKIPTSTGKVTLYGETHTFKILCIKVLWYRVAKSRPFHLLIVKDPNGKYDDEFFFTTDLSLLPQHILDLIAGRWSIEVTHRNSKQIFGLSHPQIRNPKSIKKQIPLGFFFINLVILWYTQIGRNSRYDVRSKPPWYH